MKKLLYLFLLFAGIAIVGGCENQHKQQKRQKVHRSVIHNTATDEWVYWYWVLGQNNTYYYYSSPTPVASYSSIGNNWSTTTTAPSSLITNSVNGQSNVVVEEMPDESMAQTEMPADMAEAVGNSETETFTSSESNFQNEAETETNTETQTSTESSSESSSESGSSDAGSSDGGGGGDSGGGGDGGGGGD